MKQICQVPDLGTLTELANDVAFTDGDSCVLDVRDIVTGEKISKSKYMDMYVIKVDPIPAFLEPEYFIKKYEDAQEKLDLEIQRVESGIEDETAKSNKGATTGGSSDLVEG